MAEIKIDRLDQKIRSDTNSFDPDENRYPDHLISKKNPGRMFGIEIGS
jgi:hypothetical protein